MEEAIGSLWVLILIMQIDKLSSTLLYFSVNSFVSISSRSLVNFVCNIFAAYFRVYVLSIDRNGSSRGITAAYSSGVV